MYKILIPASTKPKKKNTSVSQKKLFSSTCFITIIVIQTTF